MKRVIRCTVCLQIKVMADADIIECTLSYHRDLGCYVCCSDSCAEKHIEEFHK